MTDAGFRSVLGNRRGARNSHASPLTYAPQGFRAEVSPGATTFDLGVNTQQNNYREWYSWAVVASVASAAGLVCHVPTVDVNQGDITVQTYGLWRGRGRTIAIQAKATSSLRTARANGIEYVSHSLKRERYDALLADATVTTYLVLIAVPPLDQPWTRVTSRLVAMRAAAWWGRPTEPPTDRATQTVRLPATARLDVAAFESMMDAA